MVRFDLLYPNLRFLALRYFHHLNQKKKDGSYHDYALIEKVATQRNAAIANNEPRKIDFWDFFTDNNHRNLKKTICGTPADLQEIIDNIESLVPDLAFCEIEKGNVKSTQFGDEIDAVFSYDALRGKQYCHDTFAKLGIMSCPYCNDIPTRVELIPDGTTGELLNDMHHQLDHFFSQVRHPYLSISLSNLIPSCSICNSKYKGTKEFSLVTHINPFDKSTDNYFQFYITTPLLDKKEDVVIRKKNIQPFPESAIDDFGLVNRYNNDEVREFLYERIQKLRFHSAVIIEEIRDRHGIEMPIENIFGIDDRYSYFNAPMNISMILRRRYGKLHRDILQQLRLDQ